MKRVVHYLNDCLTVKRVVTVFAAAMLVASMVACQEDNVVPADSNGEPSKHPAKVTVPEIKISIFR